MISWRDVSFRNAFGKLVKPIDPNTRKETFVAETIANDEDIKGFLPSRFATLSQIIMFKEKKASEEYISRAIGTDITVEHVRKDLEEKARQEEVNKLFKEELDRHLEEIEKKKQSRWNLNRDWYEK